VKQCKHCMEMIHDKATRCPKCAGPVMDEKKRAAKAFESTLVIVIVGVVVLALVAIFSLAQ
jgi:uncharacterized paraquat-inducible protein A